MHELLLNVRRTRIKDVGEMDGDKGEGSEREEEVVGIKYMHMYVDRERTKRIRK